MPINKKILLTALFGTGVFVIVFVFLLIDNSKKEQIELLKKMTLKEAVSHFDAMLYTRAWNAQYGGVYVKQRNRLEPNPYLADNMLKSDRGDTLIKINPAWMTRQISEITNLRADYRYKITSLNPINPKNRADDFEKEALEFFEKNRYEKYYYRFSDSEDEKNRFYFMGVLKTEKSCLQCHAVQGYKEGDVRGGIRVTISTDNYQSAIDNLSSRFFILKNVILFAGVAVFILFGFMINRLIKYQERIEEANRDLEKRVEEYNNEKVLSTKAYRPLTLIFTKQFNSENDARKYDRLLKDKRSEKERIIKLFESEN